ncbi:unnamed protein product [Hyaloperonospora brassicae]|uniref:Secreted protein n=1 Tax=Hyaloperonospora brassicae TaxID=162125 RepID=A0AAV0TKK5_HYABA|nr:unnamed protein product [Hyaloperonospora brassicae]
MQYLFPALSAIAAAVALVIAEQQVTLKIHVGPGKFYVTPIGQQCAFNNCIDPQVYPYVSVKQDYNSPKLLCPYPNPYNKKLGKLHDEESDDDVEQDQ